MHACLLNPLYGAVGLIPSLATELQAKLQAKLPADVWARCRMPSSTSSHAQQGNGHLAQAAAREFLASRNLDHASNITRQLLRQVLKDN